MPSSLLVVVEDRRELLSPWASELIPLIAQSSTNQDYEPYDLVAELVVRSCVSIAGRVALGPSVFMQSVDDYITSIHSRNGFSRNRMTPDAATQFDSAVRDMVTPCAKNNILELHIETHVAWGHVMSPDNV